VSGEGRRILVLAPHPDDEVVGCCAALGRALREGARASCLYLTTGVPAREVLWPWARRRHGRRVERRRAEARRAAALLGIAPVDFAAVPSRRLKEHLGPARARVQAALRELAIDLLWVPAYEGGHQDHDAASFLASTLRDAVEVWEFSEYNYAGGRVRAQAFPRPSGAERAIELDGEERARKRRALALYASERGNLRHVGVAREVLRPLAAYDYSRPPHPGTLFYQRFQWVPRHPRVDHTRPEEVCAAFRRFAAAAACRRGAPGT
jgi:LmbE family N-acetylglucosaminyl deacetylase